MIDSDLTVIDSDLCWFILIDNDLWWFIVICGDLTVIDSDW